MGRKRYDEKTVSVPVDGGLTVNNHFVRIAGDVHADMLILSRLTETGPGVIVNEILRREFRVRMPIELKRKLDAMSAAEIASVAVMSTTQAAGIADPHPGPGRDEPGPDDNPTA